MLLVEFVVVILQLYIKTHTHCGIQELILFLHKVHLQGVPKKVEFCIQVFNFEKKT